MKISRYSGNPIIVEKDVKPSQPGYKVLGVFNCGAIKYNGEYLLLCRVAEAVENDDPSLVKFPELQEENGVEEIRTVTIVKAEHPDWDFSDSRKINYQESGMTRAKYMTSFSHLRIARSKDGSHFTVDEKPCILPSGQCERWGMEDPRVVQIEDAYYVTYTACSPRGSCTAMIKTNDFRKFERMGIIFMPQNKDVTIFPEKINGRYYALNRPVPKTFGDPNIWISDSQDLLYWGNHRFLCGVGESGWDCGRIGSGAIPIKTPEGWIVIYHGANKTSRYSLGLMLLDKDDPSIIISKPDHPFMEPEAPYETSGFFGQVVFTCGAIVEGNNVKIYYGACDNTIALAETTISEMLRFLKV